MSTFHSEVHSQPSGATIASLLEVAFPCCSARHKECQIQQVMFQEYKANQKSDFFKRCWIGYYSFLWIISKYKSTLIKEINCYKIRDILRSQEPISATWNVSKILPLRFLLRWLEILSSTCILMGRYNHSLSLDATIMVSKINHAKFNLQCWRILGNRTHFDRMSAILD